VRSFCAKIICLSLALVLIGCGKEPPQEDILKSMAEFDRVYIPSLLFTNLQKQRESEIAMGRLKREWERFYKRYYGLEIKYGMNITDKFWKEDLDVVEGLLVTAEAMIMENKLEEAHEQLEVVREVLRDLRHRNGLAYYLDGMNEFHHAMEQIILSLRGKDRLSDRDLERLRGWFRQAQKSWSKVSRTEINPELFGFDPEKVDAVRKRVKEEERVLAIFAAALSSQDADRIFQAAQDLKPNFVVLYKAFGDFQPIFDQIIKERKEKEEEEDETGSE